MGRPLAWFAVRNFSLRLTLYLVPWMIFLSACSPTQPSSTALPISPSPQPSTTPSPQPSSSPSLHLPTSPSPPSTISGDSANQLTEITRITFPTWALVQALCWSPDGNTLAIVAGEDVHFYQVGSFQEEGTIHVGVWSPGLAFSPDGRLLATASRDGKLRLWDAATGKLKPDYPLEAHRKGVNQVAFSPDGKLIATGGNDGMARLWDVETGKRVNQMIGGAYAIPAVAFTPDGAGLAIVNAGVIRFRDIETGRFMRTLRSDHSIYSLAFSPDGKMLASSHNDNTIDLWETETESLFITIDGHTGLVDTPSALVWQVAFSPDGSLLASAGGDATLRLWNSRNGDLAAILQGHAKAVTSVAFDPHGQWLASGGLDSVVLIWGIE